MKKIVEKFVNGSVALVNKYLPDAFIFAALLTFVTFVFAAIVMFTFKTPVQGYAGEATFFGKFGRLIYDGWYGMEWNNSGYGFWSLLGFSMQMSLIIITGSVFANTPQMKVVLTKIARIPKTPGQAVFLEAFFSIFVAFIQWGAALIMSAMLAKEIAKNVPGTHFALLVACGYLGLGMWHGGLSGSVPLVLPNAKYVTGDELHLPMSIPFKYTIFAPYNLFNYIGGMILLPLVMWAIHPKGDKVVVCDPSVLVDDDIQEVKVPRSEMKVNEKLNNSKIINYFIVALGAIVIFIYFQRLIQTKSPFTLTIDFVNFLFLVLAMAFYGNPLKLIDSVGEAAGGAAGVMLQFPFYGGICGLMVYDGGVKANDSLAEVVANFFYKISNKTTYPLLTFLSAGIINFFIPSGGGQWAVQGPIVMPAANNMALTKLGYAYGSDEYKAYLGKSAMALAWGDASTNLIQPFWALPLLAIAKLQAKDIMGYCVLALLVLIVWVCIGFIAIP